MSHRTKVFYGWWVVATAALGLCLGGAPITVYSFGVFFKPLSQDFHAGRAAISLAFTLHNMVSAFCAFFVGRLIDRFGARKTILLGTAIFGLVLLSARSIGHSIVYFYFFYAALGVVGGSAGPLTYGVVISHWFNRRRGLALGLMLLGIGIGATTIPLVAQRMMAAFGWRETYALLGCAVLLISLPVVGALLKNDPTEMGLLPDGDLVAQQSQRDRVGQEGLNWHETWHSRIFWLMISAFFLAGASVHACVLHMPALLTDRGISAQGAAVASSTIGFAVLLGRVGTGCLLDWFFGPRLAMFLFGGASLGVALLWGGGTGKIALMAAFLVGLSMGAEADIIAYLMSRYFGLRAFGTAFGFAFGSFVLAGALGTLTMGAGFDLTHSYSAPLGVMFFFMLGAIAFMSRLGPYRYAAGRASHLPEAKEIEAASHA
jgi:MFS family permease